ncbi:MAG: Mu-like prophage major head subunit gpT family protein [Desulfobulbaceae bacterium]|jgi:phage major head subunit gpT-like protein
MLVNKTSVQAAFTVLLTIFNKMFQETEVSWTKFATEVPSSGASNDYSWLSQFPKMREWIGDKYVRALAAYNYVVKNKDFEATVEVDRNDIEDDNLGIYKPLTEGAAKTAKEHPDELMFLAADGVFTNPCFDNQYMVDTDHPVAGASVSNKLTVALACDTQANAIASYGAAKAVMTGFKDDEGRPLKCRPSVLMVGNALETKAKLLMTADKLDDGKPNPFRGECEVVVNPEFDSTEWLILDTKKPLMPFLYQNRKAPVFVSQTDPQAEDVFMKKKFKYGVEARSAAAYSFWQLVVGSTGAG